MNSFSNIKPQQGSAVVCSFRPGLFNTGVKLTIVANVGDDVHGKWEVSLVHVVNDVEPVLF